MLVRSSKAEQSAVEVATIAKNLIRGPAYFNRDYKRQFGEPPMRDVERLRELATP
jgi:hypothetical protein